MKKYEVMFIVRPDLEEANIKTVAENMKKVLTDNGGKVVEEKPMGQRELAYEINKYKTGYYFLFVVEANDAKATEEFDRISRISEDVIRSLIIKIDAEEER